MTVTFSEPVNGFVQSELSVTGTSSTSITAWNPQAGGTYCIATVTPTETGSAIFNVAQNVAQDNADNDNTPAIQQAVTVNLPPDDTVLLQNYPNPFNPETWIPYRLAEEAFVTLTIYDLNGQVIRALDVGHQIAAVYENRSTAIYWDGRNGSGEPVASGVYFYTLTAGDYSATRKMMILK